VVDSTVAMPIALRTIESGFATIVHSPSEILGGLGAMPGGAMTDRRRLRCCPKVLRFATRNELDAFYHGLVYPEHFGATVCLDRCRNFYVRSSCAAWPLASAFLILRGVKTMPRRIEPRVQNSAGVVPALRETPPVVRANYVGFTDIPYHLMMRNYIAGQPCSSITFGVRGGAAAGAGVYCALPIIKRLVKLGDVRSVACFLPSAAYHRHWDKRLTVPLSTSADLVRRAPVRQPIGRAGRRDSLAKLDFEVPMAPEPLLAWTIGQMDTGIVHAARPRYFGLINPAPNFASRRADRIASAFKFEVASATCSPALIENEAHIARAVVPSVGAGPAAFGHFCTGGSVAHDTALMAELRRAEPEFAKTVSLAFSVLPLFHMFRDFRASAGRLRRTLLLPCSAPNSRWGQCGRHAWARSSPAWSVPARPGFQPRRRKARSSFAPAPCVAKRWMTS
jgi:hypothetical protein